MVDQHLELVIGLSWATKNPIIINFYGYKVLILQKKLE